MRINQAETAIASFHSLSVPHYLQPAEAKVMALFAGETVVLTRKQIRNSTDMELSSVCGRVNSLLAKGKLAVRGEVIDQKTKKPQELLGLPVPVQRSLEPEAAAA